MNVICTNDTYPSQILEKWHQYGVSYPIKDKIYTIRTCQRHSNGKIGIRVEEIINPSIPVKHYILGQIIIEPTFDISRFASLSGEVLTNEVLEQIEHESAK